MKILHINTSDINGGATRAAYRLHRALLTQDVNSQTMVHTKASEDRTVIGFVSKIDKCLGRLRLSLEQLPNRLCPHKKLTPFHTVWFPLSEVKKKIQEIIPDIVISKFARPESKVMPTEMYLYGHDVIDIYEKN